MLWEPSAPLLVRLSSCQNLKNIYIYPLIKSKSVIYSCYIDNIFMVWVKSESELRQFMNKINQKHQSIKFDFKFSKESIEFLDTLVYIDSNNRLQTNLYKKPTNCQNYLRAKLAHPFSLKKSIPYSQALRITGNIPKA